MEDDTSNTDMTKERSANTDASDVKDKVKGKVEKGVAAVAGALKGFTEEAKKHDLAGTTKEAIHKAGETTRELAGAATQELKKTKEHLKSPGDASTRSGSPYRGASSSSYGPESSGSSSSPGSGATPTGGTSTTSGSSSKIGSSASSVPDLRKTDLAKADDELEE